MTMRKDLKFSMITLRNIKETENSIECDFWEEQRNEKCHMVVDKKTKEIISKSAPDGYKIGLMSPAHVRAKLESLIGTEEMPEVVVHMWY